jgi:acyl-[acyl carrier protein]--UDP-N-acetylglucosamine O-acyltransferase
MTNQTETQYKKSQSQHGNKGANLAKLPRFQTNAKVRTASHHWYQTVLVYQDTNNNMQKNLETTSLIEKKSKVYQHSKIKSASNNMQPRGATTKVGLVTSKRIRERTSTQRKENGNGQRCGHGAGRSSSAVLQATFPLPRFQNSSFK